MIHSWDDLIFTLLPQEQKPTETQAGMIADSVPSTFVHIIADGFAKSQNLHLLCAILPDFAPGSRARHSPGKHHKGALITKQHRIGAMQPEHDIFAHSRCNGKARLARQFAICQHGNSAQSSYTWHLPFKPFRSLH